MIRRFFSIHFYVKNINPNFGLIPLQGIMIWTNLFLNYLRMPPPKLQLFYPFSFREVFYRLPTVYISMKNLTQYYSPTLPPGIIIWANLFLNYLRMLPPKLQLFLVVRFFFREFLKIVHGIYFYIKIRPPLWFHAIPSDRDFNKLKFTQPEFLQHKLQLFLFRLLGRMVLISMEKFNSPMWPHLTSDQNKLESALPEGVSKKVRAILLTSFWEYFKRFTLYIVV